ncbi:MAG: aldo/keto reductase [Proteobacteria bacterium]|nr:aldo/keto reductase [Pseudomonadota bacterium]
MAELNRRDFLKIAGAGAAAAAMTASGCGKPGRSGMEKGGTLALPEGKMTYRKAKNGDIISLLGFGMMRLPTIDDRSARDTDSEIDQEMVNSLIDEAIQYGVNYFDTSPAYCKGKSEAALGIALKKYPRDKFFVATKLSNFAESTWSREESLKIYENSFKNLQVDTIDYMLLHGIGMGEDGMKVFNSRYIDNGMLDFLLEERKKGRIRNLGFSYHGDIAVFDHALAMDIDWDFVQIQLNFVDWKHAKEVNTRNTNAEYLYGELQKRNIPAIVMEPLLGGRLARLDNNKKALAILKKADPEASPASWSMRYAGNPDGVLTVLSGMTYREHLRENLRTCSPHKPLSQQELDMLEDVAQTMLAYKTIPCNTCQYCMPCPYGLDIPSIFVHYNKCLNEDRYINDINDPNYIKARREFLIGYDRGVPRMRQADHCIGCNKCSPHCPQRIDIPAEMQRIDKFVNFIKKNNHPNKANT